MRIVAKMLFSPVIADKLREDVVEYQICLRLKKLQAQAKIFCRVLDIRVAKIVGRHIRKPRPLNEPLHVAGNGTWITRLKGIAGTAENKGSCE